MSTLDGMPAHILLNHFVVVLIPLTAVLAILCAVWPAARRRLIWLVLALAVITTIVTPLTISAGGWLIEHADQQSALMDHHAELGDTMIYFAAALLIGAALLAAVHVRQARGHQVKPVPQGLVAVLVIAVGVAAFVQVHRVGESGAQATWCGFMTDVVHQACPR